MKPSNNSTLGDGRQAAATCLLCEVFSKLCACFPLNKAYIIAELSHATSLPTNPHSSSTEKSLLRHGRHPALVTMQTLTFVVNYHCFFSNMFHAIASRFITGGVFYMMLLGGACSAPAEFVEFVFVSTESPTHGTAHDKV
ncbi:hypothetical protein PMIN03_007347 [Paraphaeosphaeria minitans]